MSGPSGAGTRRRPDATSPHELEVGAHALAEDARRAENRRWFRILARVGVSARALVYLVIALLMLSTAVSGHRSGSADSRGAFVAIAHQPGGTLALAVLAGGLAAYAAWRLVQAAAGRRDGRPAPMRTRLAWLVSAGIYCVLAADALLLLAGAQGGGSLSQHPAPLVGRALALPGGAELVGLVATGVAAGGVGLIVYGFVHDHALEVFGHRLGRIAERAARLTGLLGDAVRGVTIALVAVWLYRAAIAGDPAEAKGLGQAVQSVVEVPAGRGVLALLGLGTICYALTSLLEATR